MLPIQKGSQEEKMALIALMMVRKIKKQMRSVSKNKKRRRTTEEEDCAGTKIELNTQFLTGLVKGSDNRGISPTDVSSVFDHLVS
jgi:hypothetical protein